MVVLLFLGFAGCAVQRQKAPPPPEPRWQVPIPQAQGNPYLQSGYVYLKQGQWAEAIQEFQKAVAWDPDSALAHAALGWAYYRVGRPDLALQEGEIVLRLEPENAQVKRLVELLRQQQKRPRSR